MSGDVTPIGVDFKTPPDKEGPSLKIVHYDGCNHKFRVTGGKVEECHYLIREGETEVECGFCGVRLDPVFVLMRLAGLESQMTRARQSYQAEMHRLAERSRTKCQHCGRMTRIRR